MNLGQTAARLLVALVLGISIAPAQTTSAGSIEGDVINVATGQPVRGARVRLQSDRDDPRFTTTDEKGHFQFADLEIKPYQVAARYPGLNPAKDYAASTSSGAVVRLTGVSPGGRVRLEMRPYSAISGKVTDPSGFPIEGAGVEVMLRYPLGRIYAQAGSRYEEGGFQYLGQRFVRTDDLGEYRIAPLPPGSYYLSVRPSPQAIEPTDRATFYPRALKVSDARPVELAEGKDLRGIDIQLIRQAGVKVSGTIRPLLPVEVFSNGTPRLYTSVLAWPVAHPGSGSGNSPIVNGDRFEIPDLLPGKYVLEAATRQPEDSYLRNPLAAARLVVDVGAESVEGIELIMAPVPELEGRVVFEPNCPVTPLLIYTHSDIHQGVPLGDVPTGPDGRFVIKRLLPGRYTISIQAQGGTSFVRAMSAKLGDIEVLMNGFEATADTKGPLLITVGCLPGRK